MVRSQNRTARQMVDRARFHSEAFFRDSGPGGGKISIWDPPFLLDVREIVGTPRFRHSVKNLWPYSAPL